MSSKRQMRGFTIMELLVATMVFAVVLLLVTAGILQIARVYYKGVTEASTQNTARSIMDTISQAIQFSGGEVSETPGMDAGTNYAFCVGNQQFSYRLGWQVENRHDIDMHQTWHGLVHKSVPTGLCSSTSTPVEPLTNQTVVGRDLMGQHMRLSRLSVVKLPGQPNVYKIQIKIVYGDDDLLDDPTTANARCKGVQAGTQFCSVAELSTVVVKRLK